MSKYFSEKEINKSLEALKIAMENDDRFILLIRGNERRVTSSGGMTVMEIIGTLEDFKNNLLNADRMAPSIYEDHISKESKADEDQMLHDKSDQEESRKKVAQKMKNVLKELFND